MKGGRWIPLWAAAMVVGAAAAGWAGEPFVIGLNTTLSGPAASYGLHYRMAAEMARDEINGAGGINGAKLELQIDDNKLSPTEAVAIAKKTLGRVHATIVGMSGSAFLAVMPVAAEMKVPIVASGLGTIAVTEGNNPWVFRVSMNDRRQGQVITDYVVEQMKKRKVAIIYDSNDYGVGGMTSVKDRLKRHGLDFAAVESFNTGELDFSAHALRLKSSGAEAVIMWVYLKEAALILKKMNQIGYAGQMVGGSAIDTEVFAELAGADGNNLPYPTYFYADPQNPRIEAFARKFRDRFKIPPDLYSSSTYDSVYIIAEAFRKAGYDKEKIRQALRETKFNGVVGSVAFSENGDSIRATHIVKWVHDKPAAKSHRERLFTYTPEQIYGK